MSARIRLTAPVRRLEPAHAEWPARLGALRDPPAQLFVAGTIPELESAVAIVGTRFAQEEALRFTRRLARELAEAGRVIVSGGAAGIDTEAHRGALEAGGSTLAILATGLIDAYPIQNAPLFAEIASRGGTLMCEKESQRATFRGEFLRRNRLIAALAHEVLVVQAPYKSGALSTAGWAKRLGKRIWTVPAAPWDEHGKGCVQLLRDGAGICTSAADILFVTTFGARGGSRKQRKSAKQINHYGDLAASSQAVWKWVQRGAGHPDEIAVALDMPAAEVQEALLDLVLRGLCRQRADGGYVSDDS